MAQLAHTKNGGGGGGSDEYAGTVSCDLAREQGELADIRTRSATYGTRLSERGDEVVIGLIGGAGA